MDFGMVYELGAGRKYEGRPMVWETRKVCKEVSHNQFTSSHLPSVLPTNIENMLGHALATSTPRIHATPPPPLNQCQRMHPQANARMKYQTQAETFIFNTSPLCSLVGAASDGSFEPHCAVRPCVGSTDPAFYVVSTPFLHPPPLLHTTASYRWI